MSEALRIVPCDNVGFARKPPVRAAEPNDSRDIDSTRLMDLLEETERLKHEIHERMQRTEAVNRARLLLAEESSRTEALSSKLAELGRAMSRVPAESCPPVPQPFDSAARVLAEDDPFHRSDSKARANLPPAAEMVPEMLVETAMGRPLCEPGETETRLARAEDRFCTTVTNALPLEPVAYGVESLKQSLEEAEELCKRAEAAALEARRHFERSMSQLDQARGQEESAKAELVSARQELTTAYQFASVAAQTRLHAAEFADKVVWWAIVSAALSWAAILWLAWFTLRSWVSIWVPEAASGAILLALMIAAKKTPVDS